MGFRHSAIERLRQLQAGYWVQVRTSSCRSRYARTHPCMCIALHSSPISRSCLYPLPTAPASGSRYKPHARATPLTKDDHDTRCKQAKPGQHSSYHEVVASSHGNDDTKVCAKVEQGARQRLDHTQACSTTGRAADPLQEAGVHAVRQASVLSQRQAMKKQGSVPSSRGPCCHSAVP
jgi:hypothetical protein